MREAIGGTWLFQIVIVFVLLFTAFMCLSINHSKAFNVKNTIVKSVERAEIVDLSKGASQGEKTIEQIAKYLQKVGYRTTGNCPNGYTGYNREGNINRNKAAFCIKKQSIRESGERADSRFDGSFPDMSYYRVIVFYQLDLPIFNETFQFKVTGDTKVISVKS